MQDLRGENWIRDKEISGLLQEAVTRDKVQKFILDLGNIGFRIYWVKDYIGFGKEIQFGFQNKRYVY